MNSFFSKARRVYQATATLRDKPLRGVLFGGLALLAGVLVRFGLGDLLTGYPFITMYPSVIVTAFLCGWRVGSAVAVAAMLIGWYFWVAPEGSWAVRDSSAFLGLFFNLITLSVILVLTAGIHRGFAQFEANIADQETLNQRLETLVAERTQALETANERIKVEAAAKLDAVTRLAQIQRLDAVGKLTGGIAHDFNNMLAIVIGSVELAERSIDRDSAKVKTYLGNALQGARRASELTARLLAFSRQQPLAPRIIDPNKLVGGMSELLRRTLGETVVVETVLAGGVWRLLADPTQLESALVNLCINGRDAMPDGGKLTIETSNVLLDELYVAQDQDLQPGQYVMVAVTDTGTGMTGDVLAKVFEPFFTTKPAGRGTGLGLSQVHGFVKQSGGHIKVYSEPGHGTTVKIYLPRHVGEDHARAAPRSAAPGSAQDGECILVVEDDERVRVVSTAVLRELGYNVLEASDPTHALALLAEQRRIDLLFTDVVMPGMNGRELAEKARAMRADLKVLFTTGYTRNAVVHNGTLDPGVAFIAKPFTLEQLSRKLRETLDD